MAGRGSQNKGNIEKIKREMTAKKQKAQKKKQDISIAGVEHQDLVSSENDNNRFDEIGIENFDKSMHELVLSKEAEDDAYKEQQDIREDTADEKKIKLVVFRIDEEEFAIKVSNIKEIIRIPAITKLPNTPEHIRGLCSLRGSLLPVLDGRKLFGMPDQDFSESSRIIVADIYGKIVGLIADKVLEVINVEEAAVKEPPAGIKGNDGGVIDGILILEDGNRVVMLLAAEKMINVDGLDEAMKQHLAAIDKLTYSEVHDDEEEQIVIFQVGSGEYAFHINYVREIIRLPEIMKVPNTASYVEGVLSLRNELLAVINMGKLLGINSGKPHELSRIIILTNGSCSFGVIVDRVSNVIQVHKKCLKGSGQDSKLIKGIYDLNKGKRLIMMLEPQKLISFDEVQEIINADHKKDHDRAFNIGEADNMNEYVVFRLGEEEYGIKIHNVQEVNRISDITHFPGAPYFIDGMVDLRGDIIPILNLRKMFDLQDFESVNMSKYIVVEYGKRKIGVLVDLVSGVMRFSGENLEEVPEAFKKKGLDCHIERIAKLNDGKRVIMLLDLSTMLNFM